MAEAFVRTLKRDYVRVNPRPDARIVIEQLPVWLAHYNAVHPHRALGYRSPREYIAQTREALSGLYGATTHGRDALRCIGDDVSRALRQHEWDSAHFFYALKKRVERLKLLGPGMMG